MSDDYAVAVRLAMKELEPFFEAIRTFPVEMFPNQQNNADQMFDNATISGFASAMKNRMAEHSAKGKGRWWTCKPDVLKALLKQSIEKGDPIDVANYCMMIWYLGGKTNDD